MGKKLEDKHRQLCYSQDLFIFHQPSSMHSMMVVRYACVHVGQLLKVKQV